MPVGDEQRIGDGATPASESAVVTPPVSSSTGGKDTGSAIEMPQLSRFRRMQIPIIAAAVYGAIRLIGPTLRVEIVGIQHAAQIRDKNKAIIGAFWHRCIFPAVWIFRDRGIVVMNTVNFDGQWTRKVIEWLGFGTAQGSSSRGGVAGLTAMAQKLTEGKHVAFTIDGPRGPRYVAKPGPVILARRTGAPISVLHIASEYGYTFSKSWDLFRVPLPWSRVVMIFAPLIRTQAGGGPDELKATQAEMQAALERVRDDAEAWFDLSEEERDEIRDEYAGREIGATHKKIPHH